MPTKEPVNDAVAFCDECIAAFAEMKPTKGVGLFVQFAACAYAALKRLERAKEGNAVKRTCDNFKTPVEAWNAYKAVCVENSLEPTIAGAISFLLSPAEANRDEHNRLL